MATPLQRTADPEINGCLRFVVRNRRGVSFAFGKLRNVARFEDTKMAGVPFVSAASMQTIEIPPATLNLDRCDARLATSSG